LGKKLQLILDKFSFSSVALLFAFAYAWRGEGCTIFGALMVIGALAATTFEKFHFKSGPEIELAQLKKDISSLQDRMGRTELSMGIKQNR